MTRWSRILKVGLFFPLVFAVGVHLAAGEAQQNQSLQADEPVETISVKIEVGSEGDALEEPLALDLGLGFPFWLHPVGRGPNDLVPFGAIPQQTTGSEQMAAGSSASFTFSSQGEAGQDQLQTTPQLLAGLRVGDISRVGFASQGRTNWLLASYEILVNGNVLASGRMPSEQAAPDQQQPSLQPEADASQQATTGAPDQPSSTAQQSKQEQAAGLEEEKSQQAQQPDEKSDEKAQEPTEVKPEKKGGEAEEPQSTEPVVPPSEQDLATLQQELADLKALVQTGLATTADQQRLKQVQAALDAAKATPPAKAPPPVTAPATAVEPRAADVNRYSAQQVQQAAQAQLAKLEAEISALASQYQDLQALDQLQLAEAHEQQQLQDLDSRLPPLRAQQDRLSRQVAGKYPWFIDEQFAAEWRKEATQVASAQVTLVTDVHTGADTANYVYFRTGGHKYLLGSPSLPLAGGTGPQTFRLHLDAGALATADLRGWSLGMLGSPQPYGQAPDRWHPKRLVVDIDERLVYDSEEIETDRRSLEAIRLIPPAHFDESGKLVTNTPIARETFVWTAGEGAGLDSQTDQMLDLPSPDDPSYPDSEPGLGDLAGDAQQATTPEDQTAPQDLVDGQAYFPGEQPTSPGYGDQGDLGGGYAGSSSGAYGGWGAPGDYGSDWGSSGGYDTGGFDAGGYGMGGYGGLGTPGRWWWFPPIPPPKDPPPAGQPFQIESVRITAGWTTSDRFTIQWKTAGDEGEIAHYDVSLQVVRPETQQVYFAHVLRTQLPAGSRKYTSSLEQSVAVSQPYFFVAPLVVAVPQDSSKTPHKRFGPARAIFDGSSGTKPFVPLQLNSMFFTTQTAPLAVVSAPVSFGGQPAGMGSAVWLSKQVEESHNAILFDVPYPALTVAARPSAADQDLSLSLKVPTLAKGAYQLVTHVGFLGGSGASDSVTLKMQCQLKANGAAQPLEWKKQVNVVNQSGGSAAPLELLTERIDTSKLTGGQEPYQLDIHFDFVGGNADPAHPPALFGLRLLPAASTMQYQKTSYYGTFSNKDFADLVCWVPTGQYSTSGTNYLAAPTEGVHFMDNGRVKVTVQNVGGKASDKCRLGILSIGKPPQAGETLKLDVKKPPPGLVTPMPKYPLGQAPPPSGQKINWLATAEVPGLKASEKKDIYLYLPPALTKDLDKDISQERYRVMVDMDNSMQVPEGPGETNNWSGPFYLKEGPHIDQFMVKDSSLIPGQKPTVWGLAYGTSRWTITYTFSEPNLPQLKTTYGSDPLQQKPYPTGKDARLPWAPWLLNQPQMKYPKLTVTLTVYNSSDTRQHSRDATVDLNDFDGTFQIVDDKTKTRCHYFSNEGKLWVQLTVKADCNKPFTVGGYGNPQFGSMYFAYYLLNPKEPVTFETGGPSMKLVHLDCIGETVNHGAYCVYPDAPKVKSKEASLASIYPLGQLPAKGEFTIAWEVACSKKLQAISLEELGWTTYKPVVRVELYIHTARNQVQLKRKLECETPFVQEFSERTKVSIAEDDPQLLKGGKW